MTERHHAERRPIQTSAVIVLGAEKCTSIPPPSPPTPSVSADGGSLCEPTDPFSLGDDEPSAEATATSRRLARGLHVLSIEAAALSNLSRLYESDGLARDGFDKAVRAIADQSAANGKLVVIGVGKSGHMQEAGGNAAESRYPIRVFAPDRGPPRGPGHCRPARRVAIHHLLGQDSRIITLDTPPRQSPSDHCAYIAHATRDVRAHQASSKHHPATGADPGV